MANDIEKIAGLFIDPGGPLQEVFPHEVGNDLSAHALARYELVGSTPNYTDRAKRKQEAGSIAPNEELRHVTVVTWAEDEVSVAVKRRAALSFGLHIADVVFARIAPMERDRAAGLTTF
jgi:hypothetical protein